MTAALQPRYTSVSEQVEDDNDYQTAPPPKPSSSTSHSPTPVELAATLPADNVDAGDAWHLTPHQEEQLQRQQYEEEQYQLQRQQQEHRYNSSQDLDQYTNHNRVVATADDDDPYAAGDDNDPYAAGAAAHDAPYAVTVPVSSSSSGGGGGGGNALYRESGDDDDEDDDDGDYDRVDDLDERHLNPTQQGSISSIPSASAGAAAVNEILSLLPVEKDHPGSASSDDDDNAGGGGGGGGGGDEDQPWSPTSMRAMLWPEDNRLLSTVESIIAQSETTPSYTVLKEDAIDEFGEQLWAIHKAEVKDMLVAADAEAERKQEALREVLRRRSTNYKSVSEAERRSGWQSLGARRNLKDQYAEKRTRARKNDAVAENIGDSRLKTLEMLLLRPVGVKRRQHEQTCVQWNERAKICQSCNEVKFSKVSWVAGHAKHHCRLCGDSICDACCGGLPLREAVQLLSTNPAGVPDCTVPQQLDLNSDPILACAYCTKAVTTRSTTRREKGTFARKRALALAEQPKYLALHIELNDLESHVQDELPGFASLAGKLQLLEGIDRYYDAMRAYADLMSAVNRMDDIAATFEQLAKHANHNEERRLLEGLHNSAAVRVAAVPMDALKLPTEQEIKVERKRVIEQAHAVTAGGGSPSSRRYAYEYQWWWSFDSAWSSEHVDGCPMPWFIFEPEASSTSMLSSSYVGSSAVKRRQSPEGVSFSAEVRGGGIVAAADGASEEDGFLTQEEITASSGHVWEQNGKWQVDQRELLFSDTDGWRYAAAITTHVWYRGQREDYIVRRRRWYRSQVEDGGGAAEAAAAPRTPPAQIKQALPAHLIPPMQSPQTPDALKETWVADEDTDTCMCCRKSKFSFFNRRHHCRHCGRLICDPCSKGRTFHPVQNEMVRTCLDCERGMGHADVAGGGGGSGRGGNGGSSGSAVGLQVVEPDASPDQSEIHTKVLWECERLVFVKNSWSGKHLLPSDGRAWKGDADSVDGGYDSPVLYERTLPRYGQWMSPDWELHAEGDDHGGWEYASAFPQRTNKAAWHQQYKETDVVRRRMWTRRLWVPIA